MNNTPTFHMKNTFPEPVHMKPFRTNSPWKCEARFTKMHTENGASYMNLFIYEHGTSSYMKNNHSATQFANTSNKVHIWTRNIFIYEKETHHKKSALPQSKSIPDISWGCPVGDPFCDGFPLGSPFSEGFPLGGPVCEGFPLGNPFPEGFPLWNPFNEGLPLENPFS